MLNTPQRHRDTVAHREIILWVPLCLWTAGEDTDPQGAQKRATDGDASELPHRGAVHTDTGVDGVCGRMGDWV